MQGNNLPPSLAGATNSVAAHGHGYWRREAESNRSRRICNTLWTRWAAWAAQQKQGLAHSTQAISAAFRAVFGRFLPPPATLPTLCLTATLAACGGGGSAAPGQAGTELRVELSAARAWSVPTDRTALLLPGRITRVQLGHELREFGIQIDGNRLTLLCEGRVVDPAEGGIPAPATLTLEIAR